MENVTSSISLVGVIIPKSLKGRELSGRRARRREEKGRKGGREDMLLLALARWNRAWAAVQGQNQAALAQTDRAFPLNKEMRAGSKSGPWNRGS